MKIDEDGHHAYHAWQLRQVIQLTMNSKHHYWTIKSREHTLNTMWRLVVKYEKEKGLR